MENYQENKLTPLQKAKTKYYQKNRLEILNKIAEINTNRYRTDELYREKLLQNYKIYYIANKDKKKEYYLKMKSLKQKQLSSQ